MTSTSASPNSAPCFVPPMENASHTEARNGRSSSFSGEASPQPSRAPSRYSSRFQWSQTPRSALSSPRVYSVPSSVGLEMYTARGITMCSREPSEKCFRQYSET